METSRITPSLARANQNVVFVLGGTPTRYFAVRILKRAAWEWPYDYVVQAANFAPLSPKGATPPYAAGTQAPWVDNVILQLQSIANVANIFTLTSEGEMLQVFVGISPSPLALYARQKVNQVADAMDWNIYPQLSYFDPGILADGYSSPFNRPAPETETWILGGIDANWALGNNFAVPITPRLNFYITRVFVEPVSDPDTLSGFFQGRIPAKWVSLGSPDADLTQNLAKSLYPGAVVTTRADALARKVA